jgi:2-succinyl-5-enolpyruvyl-6-hydroxy-3-cyclohexene-1-carboxylate synthase
MTTDRDAQATFAATLVEEWERAGLTDAVVAPGSRSTPMLVALERSALRLHVVLDERSAGFVALGLGKASGRPAVVVTTSGTAAVELHPAVVEAHQAAVPLIAVTADRPAELHGVGAPQTVEQEGLFGGAVRWAASPGVPDRAVASTWRSVASRAVAEAMAGGPVHLNLAFREPLLGEVVDMPPGRPDGRPWHRGIEGRGSAAAVPLEGRGVIVAGEGVTDPLAVHALAERLGWPVLADPLSGCRQPGPGTVAAADALLRIPGWSPDMVLRLGRPWTSKVMANWLAGLGVPQVVVGGWADPDRVARTVVRADPSAFCRALLAGVVASKEKGAWLDAWQAGEKAAQAAIEAVLAGHDEATEPAVARTLAATVPDGTTLVASSSMPVRDVEWFTAPRRGLRVLANRGANGIDGVVSTALGVALAAGPTVALLGDLAFLYDAGALLWARQRGVPLTLVVADNGGGGIFSFLPQATAVAEGTFERLWGTPHGVDLVAVAAAYGMPARRVERAAEVAPAVAAAVASGQLSVVVVSTDRGANVAVHDEINAAVAKAVGAVQVR